VKRHPTPTAELLRRARAAATKLDEASASIERARSLLGQARGEYADIWKHLLAMLNELKVKADETDDHLTAVIATMEVNKQNL
jgi:hypothetical protein